MVAFDIAEESPVLACEALVMAFLGGGGSARRWRRRGDDGHRGRRDGVGGHRCSCQKKQAQEEQDGHAARPHGGCRRSFLGLIEVVIGFLGAVSVC